MLIISGSSQHQWSTGGRIIAGPGLGIPNSAGAAPGSPMKIEIGRGRGVVYMPGPGE